MKLCTTVLLPFALAWLSALAAAQSQHVGPSVLNLQTSYHVGIYSTTIDVPSGALMLLSQSGTFDVTSAGALTGALDTYEWTTTGLTITPNDPVAGAYYVAPEGICELDFDPANPGNDVFALFVDAEGATLHMARYDLDPEALGIVILEKSTGQSNASLNGSYHFYGQRMELVAAGLATSADRGTMAFNGAGGLTVSGTELSVAANGSFTSTPFGGPATYSVAPDGALVLDGAPGGISASGELLFATDAVTANPDVGMVLGVRIGQSYDHADLAGRYTLHGKGYELGTDPSLPLTITDIGVLELAATSATTGTWSADGYTVDGNSTGQTLGQLSASGTTSLASNGILTMTEPGGLTIELAFSDSGRFAIGRVVDNLTNLFFVTRACVGNGDFGSGTAGSGGIEPELGMRTFPTLGNSGWRFAIVEGLGGAPAILPVSFGGTFGLPLGGGLVWIDPTQIAWTPFLVLGGATGMPGAGSVDVSLSIPTNPVFAGFELFAQAFVLDPGAPANAAMSRGFRVEICR